MGITYDSLSHEAFFGTAENFKKFLTAYGKDETALQTMQYALEGWVRKGQEWSFSQYKYVPIWSHWSSLPDGNKKKDLLADYVSKTNDFAPKEPAANETQQLMDKFNAMAARVEALEKELADLKKPAQPSKEALGQSPKAPIP